ncbi:BNR repeat-containing protein [Massilia rhizosphaerae]|uniref:BNR repeat-containing protein n=1 Tax=Massilia rhizosphaerae TaxID=2784389 RepID=UPI001E5A4F63|nr:BNR repeat-containing protein [Massilia rhizosphaerae]
MHPNLDDTLHMTMDTPAPTRYTRLLVATVSALAFAGCAQLPTARPQLSDVAPAWAANSVNTVVFRKNSLVTAGDTQYIAFYDSDRYVVLGRRKLGTRAWTLHRTQYQGNAADAHNTISIMVDGAGYLHVAWDHHDNRLRYAKSVRPGALALGDRQPMTGQDEDAVTYPEFHRMPDGDLLFLFRNGASGEGNLVVNRYDVRTGTWHRLFSNLISGEGERSAYWQAFVDGRGTIHLSWVWRESPDVSSNHDLAYARSRDGGRTWEKSDGERYVLPITAATAEYAVRIPTGSELINQTSMSADRDGRPYIATYWRDRDSRVPQYRIVRRTAAGWQVTTLGFRHTPFSLAGGGTKAIPIARPQIMIDSTRPRPAGVLVFRDAERGNKVSVVTITDFDRPTWSIRDLDEASVGAWEPTFDTELWRDKGELDLFVQDTSQVDGEGEAVRPPSLVRVLAWKPSF